MALARDVSFVERAHAARGSVTAVMDLARAVGAGACEGLLPTRVGVLSTFTTEPLSPYLVVEGAVRGLHLEPQIAPFNQLELQAFLSDGPLYAQRPDLIVVAARLEDWAPALSHDFVIPRGDGQPSSAVDALLDRMRALLVGIRERTSVPVLIWNFAQPIHLAAGLADPSARPSQASLIQQANDRLAKIIGGIPDAFVVDYARLVVEQGLVRITDRRLWYRGRIPFGSEGLMAVAALTARCIAAVRRVPRKCLVVDLDDTLWGGVLGEDGPGGIRLGEDHPGNVYKAFQRYLLSLRDRGVLLAVASKNDRDDAVRVLSSHPDCILRPEHLSAIEIGWDDKASALRRIAHDLSIGTDALAFVDDSPVERAWVATHLPEVAVIDVPADPLGFVDAIEESGVFDMLRFSAEDRKRADMYGDEQDRRQLQAHAPSVGEFLISLAMTASIGAVDARTLPRVVQLLAKTNQFNTTTRRHTGSQVEEMLASGAVALWIRTQDRFGDSGLVGAAIAVPESMDGAWRLDVLLLSCRVIGRGVEDALMAELVRRISVKGGRRLIGEFIRTERNAPAAGFFERAGFAPAGSDGRYWARDLKDGDTRPPSHISVTIEDDAAG
jgi:FkbH-like protein